MGPFAELMDLLLKLRGLLLKLMDLLKELELCKRVEVRLLLRVFFNCFSTVLRLIWVYFRRTGQAREGAFSTLKTMIFVLKTMIFVLKTMIFVLKNDGFILIE